MSGAIRGRAIAAHPDRRTIHVEGSAVGHGRTAVGADVQNRRLGEGRGVVRDDPAAVRRRVAVRCPARVDLSVCQQQRRPLLVLPGSEHRRTRRIGCRGVDFSRPVEQLRSRRDVQGVETLMVIGGLIDGHCHDIQGAMGACRAIDHRSRGDADLGGDLAATMGIAGSLAVRE